MKRRIGATLAVPRAMLGHAGEAGDAGALAFETARWTHFTSFLAQVEQLAPDFTGATAGVTVALDQLRRVLQRFGSPARLRQLLAAQPAAASGPRRPAMLYAGIVWWSWQLQGSASGVVLTMRQLAEPAGAHAEAARKASLRRLGALAATGLRQIGPLLVEVNDFKCALLSANGSLAAACADAAALLQSSREAVGALRLQVRTLERQLGRRGRRASHRTEELLRQHAALRAALARNEAQSARIKTELAALDAIVDAGAWSEAGLGDLLAVMNRLRTAWSRFGSAMTQLALDASATQLASRAWIERTVERDEAICEWDALGRSARRFASASRAGVAGAASAPPASGRAD
jgi:hypothetical protein